jgi:hypothetical protein
MGIPSESSSGGLQWDALSEPRELSDEAFDLAFGIA